MSRSTGSMRRWSMALLAAGALSQMAVAPAAQAQAAQKIDEEYTAQIKKYLSDPRISTELVDHLPASDTVPTPLKFLGRIVGAPGELTTPRTSTATRGARQGQRRTRAKFWKIGKTEEGRDMVLLAIADESDDRESRQVQGLPAPAHRSAQDDRGAGAAAAARRPSRSTAITSGMHSPETGGPEMLIELAVPPVVEETPFIQNIRNNVITLITPVIEVDGREKQVDTYYFNKKRAAGRRAAAADVLGQVRRSTTTTATAWASSSS